MDLVFPFFEQRDKPGSPMASYDRGWRWGLSSWVGPWGWQVGVAQYLTRFEGKPERNAKMVWSVHLAFRPQLWRRFGGEHDWYDGTLCEYALGPFAVLLMNACRWCPPRD